MSPAKENNRLTGKHFVVQAMGTYWPWTSLCGNTYYSNVLDCVTESPDEVTCRVCKKLLLNHILEKL